MEEAPIGIAPRDGRPLPPLRGRVAQAGFGPSAFMRLRAAEDARPERRLAPAWPAVFTAAFARLGLGLGWSAGLSMVFGAASNTALAGSMGAFALLVMANLALAYPLPAQARFLRLGANLDSPWALSNLALWCATALTASAVVLLLVAPESNGALSILVGLDALALLPAALAMAAGRERIQPRPRWKTPFLPFFYLFSGLATGALVYASYGFVLNGASAPLFWHLLAAFVFLGGEAYFLVMHILFARPALRGSGSFLPGFSDATVLAVYVLGALVAPVLLTLPAFFLDGYGLWIFAPAPLLACAALFAERVIFVRLEKAFS